MSLHTLSPIYEYQWLNLKGPIDEALVTSMCLSMHGWVCQFMRTCSSVSVYVSAYLFRQQVFALLVQGVGQCVGQCVPVCLCVCECVYEYVSVYVSAYLFRQQVFALLVQGVGQSVGQCVPACLCVCECLSVRTCSARRCSHSSCRALVLVATFT